MFLSFSCDTCEPKCVCIVHLPVFVHAYMCVCVLISQPPTLPPSSCWRGGRQGSERPVSSRTPSSSPLSARQLGSGLCRTLPCRGLTFALHPLTPLLPSPLPRRFICKRPINPSILFFHLSTPGQAVVSRLKFKSLDRPGRPGPRQATTDQTRQQGSGEGG